MFAGSADAAIYIVGDVAGGWSPTKGIEMTEVDGGWKWTGTINDNQYFTFATQLLESDDWDTFNSTYRLNPAGNGTVAQVGEYPLTLGGKDNSFKGIGAELTLFVKEVDGKYSLTVCEPVTDGPTMYIIGAPAGEWGTNIGIKMTPIEGGWTWTGTVAETDYFSFAIQLVDPADFDSNSSAWDEMDAKYRLSPDAGNDTAAATGEYGLHFGAPAGAFHGTGEQVTYLVKEKDGVYTLTVTEKLNTWSVVGAFNGWGETPDVEMTKLRSGVWTATLHDFSGEFKFRANGAWELNYGASDDGLLEADGNYAIALNGANFNIPEVFEEVILVLDLNEKTLTVDGLTPPMLALRGNFVDWEFEWSYLFQPMEDNNFMLYLDGVEEDWKFKIADQTWTEQYTTDIMDMTAGQKYDLKPGAGLGDMGVDKTYSEVTMFFNLKDNLFWFTGEVFSSVAAVEIETGKARYFNLQGCEVSNPSNGIFIRVIDGRSEKILVK